MAAALSLLEISSEGCYELSIGNPDKGTMPIEECKKRIQQFIDADLPILVTKVKFDLSSVQIFYTIE